MPEEVETAKTVVSVVTILVIGYDDGTTNVWAFSSEENARKFLYDYVEDHWEDRFEDGEEVPNDPKKAIDQFFDGNDEEFSKIEVAVIDATDGAPVTVDPTFGG